MLPPHQAVPRIDPRVLRPRRFWYVVAVAVLLLPVVPAVLTLRWATDLVFSVPEGFHELKNGRATVQLTPDRTATLYASEPVNSGDIARLCTVSGPGDATLGPVTGETQVTDTSEWIAVSQLSAPAEGEYTVACSPQGGTEYALGPPVAELTDRADQAAAVAALFFLLVGLGVAGCVTIVLVTTLRRSGHRKRLLTGVMHPR